MSDSGRNSSGVSTASTGHSRHSRRRYDSSSGSMTTTTTGETPHTIKDIIRAATGLKASSTAGVALTAVLEKDRYRTLTFSRVTKVAAMFAKAARSRKLDATHIEYAVDAILVDFPEEAARVGRLLERDVAMFES